MLTYKYYLIVTTKRLKEDIIELTTFIYRAEKRLRDLI